ncbi:unnamed protein product, partial [Rhizoctonia solani]
PVALLFGVSPLLLSATKGSSAPRGSRPNGIFRLFFGNALDDDSTDEDSDDLKLPSYGEGPDVEPMREKRLQRRIQQWKDDSLVSQTLSSLRLKVTSSDTLGTPGTSTNQYGSFRSCIFMPSSRNGQLERAAREKRRREINVFRVCLAIAGAGAKLDNIDLLSGGPEGILEGAWTTNLVETKVLSQVVDRAAFTSTSIRTDGDGGSLVHWDGFCEAWASYHSIEHDREAWITSKISEGKSDGSIDEVLERVKKMNLSSHERTMLRCVVNPDDITSTFDTIHLPAGTIDRIRTLVSLPLLYPEVFQSGVLKQHSMAGALLFGPPGTGKTLIARAVAKESGARMIAIKPSDIQDKYVGESEKQVTAVFKLARRLMPCLIFVDEIDAVLGARSSQADSNSARHHASLITTFMQEMDGLLASKVVVIGATNRPFDLDDAVLRRLPCRVLVDLPGKKAREEILSIMMRDETLSKDLKLDEIAARTEHYSGSDLKHLCLSAAVAAVKEQLRLPWAAADTSSCVGHERPISASANSQLGHDTLSPGNISSSVTGNLTPSAASTHGTTPSISLDASALSSKSDKVECDNQRVICYRHFVHALAEVKPSSSESDMSVKELRRWNAKMGAGESQEHDTPPPQTGNLGPDILLFETLGQSNQTFKDSNGGQSDKGTTTGPRETKKPWTSGWRSKLS